MRRRLPVVALLAAAAALIPTSASAAPAEPATSAVSVSSFTSYRAAAVVPLPDGRVADVSLGQYRSTVRDDWAGQLTVSLQTGCTSPGCPSLAYGSAQLSADQVSFDRRLEVASVSDVPVTLSSVTWGPGGMAWSEIEVRVSVTFTGTGSLTRDHSSGDVCGSGDPCLRSLRTDASRPADVALTLDDDTAASTGSLSRGWSLDVAPTTPSAAY